ncbi:hypothetical protein DFJ74DRAFT_710738 [Hyaloraphidium curvatum]|nr:hypothetical protein DFJ74DRAFT_710738 [Hyaloraphidium curvatum]
MCSELAAEQAIADWVPALTICFLAFYLDRLALVGLCSAAAANREIALLGELYSQALSEPGNPSSWPARPTGLVPPP